MTAAAEQHELTTGAQQHLRWWWHAWAACGSPIPRIPATNVIVSSLDMIVLSSESSDLEGEVKAETRDAKDVRVRVERLTDTSSKLRIRVGTFGDKDVGRVIYDRIVERL